jgi:hypothetical protein
LRLWVLWRFGCWWWGGWEVWFGYLLKWVGCDSFISVLVTCSRALGSSCSKNCIISVWFETFQRREAWEEGCIATWNFCFRFRFRFDFEFGWWYCCYTGGNVLNILFILASEVGIHGVKAGADMGSWCNVHQMLEPDWGWCSGSFAFLTNS